MPTDLRPAIQTALAAFAEKPLKEASLAFLETLGYASDRVLDLGGSSPDAFRRFIRENAAGQSFDETKALFADWKSADLLFQLTDDELSGHRSLFEETVQPGLLRSYLFFAIELGGDHYARGKLTAVARQLNRVFPMPVMVLIKHGGSDNPAGVYSGNGDKMVKRDKIVSSTLSIAVINRRQNKRDAHKDVLGKVTIIRDISLAEPHRGHLDILDSLGLANLVHPQRLPVNSFDGLHAAWEEIFNVELLNKRFYRELSNWYFWAMRHCHFPLLDESADKYFLYKDREKVREHEAKNLIRLLTRVLFVWFIKEKRLVPDAFFDPHALSEQFLEDFDSESKDTRYYKAILQNLFFASLNQVQGKREFRKTGQHHNTTNLLRYEADLKDPQAFIDAVEATTPFLNGGLFDCLDYPHPTKVGPQGGKVTIYEDGFSDRKDNPLVLPDFLFFGRERIENLSEEFGDPKRKAEKVRGLIPILNGYKFTIVENTPIEQEIALDPELLGQVFENLLASYNEETKTTARKQTGSFYTPRPIVDYMVDESLKAYLEKKVAESSSDNPVADPSGSSSDNPVADPSLHTEAGLPLLPFNPDAPTEKTRANLPHWSQEGTTYWVTFRLADSLPREKLNAWKTEREIWVRHHPEPWSDIDWREYDERFGKLLEEWLDAGAGECHLRYPDVRAHVAKCLTHFDGDRYDLGPWVIMPNHVHLLIRPKNGQNLSKIMQGIKGVSAKDCNAHLGRTGQPFWQEESFDHIVRSQAQYDRFARYIAENPVKARLKEGEYQWSSDNPVAVVPPHPQCGSDNPVAVPEGNADNPVAESPKPETRLSRLPLLRSRLDHLFSYTDEPHQFTPAETDILIRAIDDCKILDPACGSGAFPMGALQKLVYILGKLDPRDKLWEQRQLAKVDKLIEAAQEIDDATFRERAITDAEAQKRDIEEAFAKNELGYGRKLYLIENCLYGVDIQSIATQVSKLRFFISLIVDQNVDRARANFGVRPLPNLETKFVTADTLIQIEKPSTQAELFELAEVSKLQRELKQVRHDLFAAKTPRTKNAKRQRDKELRETIAAELKQNGWDSAAANKLAAWDPYDQNASAPYFDPEWMFGLKGFDIVIGNPPYIQIQKFPKAQKDKWIDQNFDTYAATADIYCLFYERGAQLLREGGHLAYITSNKWMRAGYGDKLRAFLADKVHTHAVLDFGMAQNFGAATTYTCITQFTRQPSQQNLRTCYAIDDKAAMHDPAGYFEENAVVQNDLSDLPWVILPPDRHAIKKQVEAQGIPLAEWVSEINYGIKTGFNDAFYLTQEQRDAFVAEDPRCADHLVPLLRGRYVSRYATNWDGTWMINSHNGVRAQGIPPVDLQKECPILFEHLSKWETQLRKRQDKGDHWSNLRNCAYLKEFSKPKIIYQDIAQSLPFYYDSKDHFYFNNTLWMLSGSMEPLPYLTAFFNSSLFRCCFRDNFPEYSGNAYRLFSIFMLKIPVRKPTPTEAALFEKLVPLVQWAKSSPDNLVGEFPAQYRDRIVSATFLEDLIDACVMECYFRDHMAEHDLLFIDELAPSLDGYDPDAGETQQCAFLEQFVATHNASKAKVRNKLLRLTADSPDLLAVIKEEGSV